MTRTRGLVLSVLVLAGGPMVAPAPADAAVVVCQRKKKIRLRVDACKPKEEQVTLSGTSVDVSDLPTVPQATSATSADTATSADSAASADTAAAADVATEAGNADTLDGLDSTAFSRPLRWALVAQDCLSIVAQSGDISIVPENVPIAGICILDFGEDLRGHGVSATVRGGLSAKGWAQTAICGAPDGGPETSLCNVNGAANTPNELAIATVDPEGNAADRSVYVVVAP